MPRSAWQRSTTTQQQWWVRPCSWLWQGFKFFWITVLFGLGLNVMATWLTTRGFDPKGTPLEWIIQHVTITLFCIVCLLTLTFITWIGSRQGPSSTLQGASQQPTEQSRTAFIHLLQKEYRRQLTQSLQGTALMALEVQERTDLVQASAQLLSWSLDEPDKRSLHSSIIEAYDEASHGLLILGAPGSGKSTLLRELANELLARAEQNLTHPIPVIVNLSSWADKKLPLSTWLIEHLQLAYALPRHFSQAWIQQNLLLLLLDGLDEVEPFARAACIDAINVYRTEHFVPLVMCSRSREYIEQRERLQVPLAVEVQPLAFDQIDQHLKHAGKPFAAVRTALKSNTILRDLITTPLMLNIMVLTYRDKMVKDLPQLGTAEQQQQQVFGRYVARMLEQPTGRWSYSSHQTQTWLIWLAQQMSKMHLSEFYLERLQYTWLPTNRLRIVYRLLDGLIVGLLIGWECVSSTLYSPLPSLETRLYALVLCPFPR